MDAPNIRKVKYVAGSGLFLQVPLSDGQEAFVADIVYEIPNYTDFQRLTFTGDFVEVKEKKVKPAVEEVPLVEVKEKNNN